MCTKSNKAVWQNGHKELGRQKHDVDTSVIQTFNFIAFLWPREQIRGCSVLGKTAGVSGA